MHEREWNSGEARIWLDTSDPHFVKTRTKRHFPTITAHHNGKLRKDDVVRASSRVNGVLVKLVDNMLVVYTTFSIGRRSEATALIDAFVTELDKIRRTREPADTSPNYRNRSDLRIVR